MANLIFSGGGGLQLMFKLQLFKLGESFIIRLILSPCNILVPNLLSMVFHIYVRLSFKIQKRSFVELFFVPQ